MKKRFALLMAVLFCVAMLAACGGGNAGGSSAAPSASGSVGGDAGEAPTGGAETLRVAAIFGGAINDGNWNETQYNGLKRIEEAGATINYMENIGDPEAAEAARGYAAEGYDIVYLTTNSYQDHCTSVAADFPETTFVQINGTISEGNFISVRIADEEQGFMQGVIAALLTQSGQVGFVGGQEINPIKLGASGFEQGVAYVNETYGLNVTATTILTGSFTDVNQAKETTFAMIEEGCDVVTPMANDASVGVMEAAEERGVLAIACGLGQEASAPTMTQVTVVKDVSLAYDATFAAFLEGTLVGNGTVDIYGVGKGVVYVTEWFVEPDAEVITRLNEVIAVLEAGEFVVDTTL